MFPSDHPQDSITLSWLKARHKKDELYVLRSKKGAMLSTRISRGISVRQDDDCCHWRQREDSSGIIFCVVCFFVGRRRRDGLLLAMVNVAPLL